jgi:hypothetical protein
MEVANEDVGIKVAEASKRIALEVTNQAPLAQEMLSLLVLDLKPKDNLILLS